MSTSARVLRPMPAVEVDPYDVSNYPGPAPWRDDAACFGDNPEMFSSSHPLDIADAKKVCVSCSVREKCLREALEFDDQWSVLGGMSPAERRALVRGGAA